MPPAQAELWQKSSTPRSTGLRALAALACVALGTLVYERNTTGAKGLSSAGAPLEIRALTETGKVVAAAAARDGRYVAYVDSDTGKDELRLVQVATDTDVQVQPPSPLRIWNIHFSPEGNSIFFLRQLDVGNPKYLGVFRVSTLGGPAEPLVGDARMYGLTVSPDGKQIAYISQTPAKSLIMLANADGANQRALADRPLELGFWFLEWSPSGDQLVAAAETGEEAMGLVTVSTLDGAMQELSAKGWTTVGEPAWSPDAATIYIPASRPNDTTTQVWAIDATTGASRQITSGPASYSQSGLSTTNAGDLVATTSNLDAALWVSDRSGRVSRLGSSRGEGLDGVAWVDGKIATCNSDEIRVRDASGSNSRKVRAYSSIYRQVVRCGPSQVAFWAMDGKRHSHIGVIDLETGSAEPQTIGQYDDEPTCNADGSKLAYVHCRDRGQQCAVTHVGPLHGLGAVNRIGWTMPTISPDGTKVLFRQTPDPKTPDEWAAIVPLDGGVTKTLKLPVPAEEVEGFRWAPDGKAILYDRNENGVGNIWSASLVGGGVRKITSFDSDRIFAFDVSPDNRLLMSRGTAVRDVVLIKKR